MGFIAWVLIGGGIWIVLSAITAAILGYVLTWARNREGDISEYEARRRTAPRPDHFIFHEIV